MTLITPYILFQVVALESTIKNMIQDFEEMKSQLAEERQARYRLEAELAEIKK